MEREFALVDDWIREASRERDVEIMWALWSNAYGRALIHAREVHGSEARKYAGFGPVVIAQREPSWKRR
eukprot:12218544-Alexandrium_andersonii.AAC.1